MTIFFSPFNEFLFMKRALLSSILLAISCCPVGIILLHRRMSLMGEALSHGILPGIALAYIFFGFSFLLLGIGGVLAGLLVAFLSYTISQKTCIPEDASFSSLYLLSLSLGILILFLFGGDLHIMHLLFGNILAIDHSSFVFIVLTSTITFFTLIIFIRPFIYDCFDPTYMRSLRQPTTLYNGLFLGIVVLNLVAACQTLGTLMALGLMMIPAVTATLLTKRIFSAMIFSSLTGIISSFLGLLLSYYKNWPSGPMIVIVSGIFYMSALFFVGFKKGLYLKLKKT